MSKRNTKRAIQILRDARALIDTGWTQGKLETVVWNTDRPYVGEYAYCSTGALYKAYTGNVKVSAEEYRYTKWFPHFQAYDLAERTLTSNMVVGGTEEYPPAFGHIIYFNDYYKTTKEDVLAAFDKAIVQLEDTL